MSLTPTLSGLDIAIGTDQKVVVSPIQLFFLWFFLGRFLCARQNSKIDLKVFLA